MSKIARSSEPTATDSHHLGSRHIARRDFLKAAAGGVAASALAAGVGPGFARAAGAQGGPVTIDYMHNYQPGHPTSITLNTLIAAFERRFPAIKVNQIVATAASMDAYQQKGYLAITGGNPPDVWTSFDGALPGIEGFLQPLNPYLQADHMTFNLDGTRFNFDDWVATERAFGAIGKTVYGLVHETDTRALWWDKAAFAEVGLNPERPPQTWSEWVAYTKRLLKKDGSGKVTRLGFAATSEEAVHPYIYMGLAGGANKDRTWMSFHGAVPSVHFDTPACIKGLEFYRTLCDIQGGVQEVTAFTKALPTTIQMPLFSGQAAMMITGVWRLADVKKYAPHLRYGVAPFPLPDAGGVPYNLSGGLQLVMPKSAKHPQEAWTFIKFLMSGAQDRAWCQNGTFIIPERHLVGNASFFREPPFSVFQNERAHSGPWPQTAYGGWPTYDPYAATQDILYHRLSAKDALARVDAEWTQKIKGFFGQ